MEYGLTYKNLQEAAQVFLVSPTYQKICWKAPLYNVGNCTLKIMHLQSNTHLRLYQNN